MSQSQSGSVRDGTVSLVLSDVDRGRLSVAAAVRRLERCTVPTRGGRFRTLELRLGRHGKKFGFRLPFFAVAGVLVAVEMALYPLLYGIARTVAWRTQNEELAQVLKLIPPFPLTHLMAAVLSSPAPLRVEVGDGDEGVLVSIG
jgi:hypothetical protein